MSVKGVGEGRNQPILPSSAISGSQIGEADLPANITQPTLSSHADAMKKEILAKALPSSRLSQVSRQIASFFKYGFGWITFGIAATVAVLVGGAITKAVDILGYIVSAIGIAAGSLVGASVGFVFGIFSGLYGLAFGPQGEKFEQAFTNFINTIKGSVAGFSMVTLFGAAIAPMIVCSFIHSTLVSGGSNILEKLQVPSSILDKWKKITRETFSE